MYTYERIGGSIYVEVVNGLRTKTPYVELGVNGTKHKVVKSASIELRKSGGGRVTIDGNDYAWVSTHEAFILASFFGMKIRAGNSSYIIKKSTAKG